VAALAAVLGHTVVANAATLPPGFQETVAFSGLDHPTAMRFSPDGRVFVAEKSGLIKVFDGLSDPTPSLFADLSTNVYNYWDRGLLGLELDPSFPTRPYVYALYTYDGAIGATAPRWGTKGVLSDPCPTPPGPTTDGCVASGRLTRLTGLPTAYGELVMADGPVGYWRLAEATGTQASDATAASSGTRTRPRATPARRVIRLCPRTPS
jgi:hypothetical protein